MRTTAIEREREIETEKRETERRDRKKLFKTRGNILFGTRKSEIERENKTIQKRFHNGAQSTSAQPAKKI